MGTKQSSSAIASATGRTARNRSIANPNRMVFFTQSAETGDPCGRRT
jgi:hypothetical protein